MKRKIGFVEEAELAARATVKEWIRQTLRESFLQAMRQAWNVRCVNNQASTNNHRDSSQTSSNKDIRNESKTQIELSLSGVHACFSFVERVSRAWQAKLKGEKHERVARWIDEVFREGQPSLWEDPLGENDQDSYDLEYSDNEQAPHEETQSLSDCSGEDDGERSKSDKSFEEAVGDDENDEALEEESFLVKDSDGDHDHPNVYCKLRSLGRRRTIDSPVLSVPDALQELKEFTQNHSTYWPLSNNIIDQACSDLSRRMLARDKHGSALHSNSSAMKTVRFKVLPKSVWETKQQQERNQNNDSTSNQNVERDTVQAASSTRQEIDQESSVETVVASIKRKRSSSSKSVVAYQSGRKKTRSSEEEVVSRPPFDAPLDPDGNLVMDLSLDEKKMVERLLILDDESQNANGAQPRTDAQPEVPLALFGGLKHVGQINYFLQNPKTRSLKPFMAKGTDRITRRKQKQSLQERLDPNRLQVGRAEKPVNQRSRVLRTENWFDDRLKFMEFDLGWCLLEITTEGRQKRLCAFSSMEICLDDNGSGNEKE